MSSTVSWHLRRLEEDRYRLADEAAACLGVRFAPSAAVPS